MTNSVKTVIAIGIMVASTQLIGYVIGKKLMKASEDALEAFASTSSPDEYSFVDVEEEGK